MAEQIQKKSVFDQVDKDKINEIVMRSSLEFVVRKLLIGANESSAEKIKALSINDSLREKGGLDSLESIDLIVSLENNYPLVVEDVVAETMTTIFKVVDYVYNNVKKDEIIKAHTKEDLNDDFFVLLESNLGFPHSLKDEMIKNGSIILLS